MHRIFSPEGYSFIVYLEYLITKIIIPYYE
ncbi:MAG: hypothetical protein K0R50_3842 [Eubacterium sp.]|nr:hypothetical protein [Eubacterium sp.]